MATEFEGESGISLVSADKSRERHSNDSTSLISYQHLNTSKYLPLIVLVPMQSWFLLVMQSLFLLVRAFSMSSAELSITYALFNHRPLFPIGKSTFRTWQPFTYNIHCIFTKSSKKHIKLLRISWQFSQEVWLKHRDQRSSWGFYCCPGSYPYL